MVEYIMGDIHWLLVTFHCSVHCPWVLADASFLQVIHIYIQYTWPLFVNSLCMHIIGTYSLAHIHWHIFNTKIFYTFIGTLNGSMSQNLVGWYQKDGLI